MILTPLSSSICISGGALVCKRTKLTVRIFAKPERTCTHARIESAHVAIPGRDIKTGAISRNNWARTARFLGRDKSVWMK